jgi:hypothetical protein
MATVENGVPEVSEFPGRSVPKLRKDVCAEGEQMRIELGVRQAARKRAHADERSPASRDFCGCLTPLSA